MQPPGEDLGAAYSRLRQSLRSYLRGRVSDVSVAEDLLHEVFVKALASNHRGHRIDKLTAWLFSVARSVLADYYRASGRSFQELDENIPERELEDLQLHQEISSCMAVFIKELPPIYRDTLIATDLQNETAKSIATKQQLSVSAIKSRVMRARAMLKDKLLACCELEFSDGLVSDYSCQSGLCGGSEQA